MIPVESAEFYFGAKLAMIGKGEGGGAKLTGLLPISGLWDRMAEAEGVHYLIQIVEEQMKMGVRKQL